MSIVESQMSTEQDATGFDSMVRFRAPETLVLRIRRLAPLLVKTQPEIGREALVRFLEAKEKELGLPPLPTTALPLTIGDAGKKEGAAA